MKKFFKGILHLLLFLSVLLMALVFFCAWKPEAAQQIAQMLYDEDDGILVNIVSAKDNGDGQSGPQGAGIHTSPGSGSANGADNGEGPERPMAGA